MNGTDTQTEPSATQLARDEHRARRAVRAAAKTLHQASAAAPAHEIARLHADLARKIGDLSAATLRKDARACPR